MTLKEECEREGRLVLQELLNDSTTPSNVLWAAKNALDSLNREDQAVDVRAANAISFLDAVKMNPSLPSGTRGWLWSAVMVLEKLAPQVQVNREGLKPLES